MPGRNVYKSHLPDSYYHVYSRGVNKQPIFLEEQDYAVFLNLFKRYLSKEPSKDSKGREYPNYHGQVELLAYCLMPNHVHALIYQHDKKAMMLLFKAIMTTYVMYFNKKYKRVGPAFQSRYKASQIMNDTYLLHISRYIHLNPKNYQKWPYSSLPYYLSRQTADWVKPKRIMELFDDRKEYQEFVADYEGHKEALEEIKYELADH